jgi:SAM-dependent methyltransferase
MLSDEYKRQFAWRSWDTIFDLLPPLTGATVLDLGCAVGDQAHELVARGASVIGFDSNQELLAAARARGIVRAEFRHGDLTALPDVVPTADGIWCSFATAYLPNLVPTLNSWKKCLKPGGWIALTEVDDLFGHEPVEPETRALFAEHAVKLFEANRYDFHMGRRLREHLERAHFTVSDAFTLPDKELSFDGPADPEVLEAWNARFDRMLGLKLTCGERFPRVREDFFAALVHPKHRSLAKVCCCIGTL